MSESDMTMAGTPSDTEFKDIKEIDETDERRESRAPVLLGNVVVDRNSLDAAVCRPAVVPIDIGPPPDGGKEAWLCIAGCFLHLFCVFGLSESPVPTVPDGSHERRPAAPVLLDALPAGLLKGAGRVDRLRAAAHGVLARGADRPLL